MTDKPIAAPAGLARRAFVTALAGGTAAAIVAPAASLASGETDPILEAIESHRAAHAAFHAAVRRNGELDAELPSDRTRSQITVWETRIVETDDPRFIESEREVARTSEAETDAAIRLVDVRPATAAGIMALLEYVLLCQNSKYRGDGWPDGLVDDNGEPRHWYHFLIENLAAALTPGMV